MEEPPSPLRPTEMAKSFDPSSYKIKYPKNLSPERTKKREKLSITQLDIEKYKNHLTEKYLSPRHQAQNLAASKPNNDWRKKVARAKSKVSPTWMETIDNKKGGTMSKEEIRRKLESIKKFQGTNLNEWKLQAIVDQKIADLRVELDPLDRMNFNNLSQDAKRLLFKHRSKTLKKYDPDLNKTLKVQKREDDKKK